MDVFLLNRFVKGMVIVFMDDVYNVTFSTEKKIYRNLRKLVSTYMKLRKKKSDLIHIIGLNSLSLRKILPLKIEP